LAVRVVRSGRSRAHAELTADLERTQAQIQSAANEIQGGDVWVEEVQVRTAVPLDLAALIKRDDPLGHLLRALEARTADPASAEVLTEAFSELERALPADLREEVIDFDPRTPETARELLDQVTQLLLPRLLETP
jgi:exonuclease SbcD